MSVWDEVDEPVLRWALATHRLAGLSRYQWRLEFKPTSGTTPDLAGMDDRQLDASLTRLKGHGLIEGERAGFMGDALAVWTNLRVTGAGFRALGEWPDLEQISVAAGIQGILSVLADELDDSEQSSVLRMSVVSIGRFAADAVRDAVAGAAGAKAEKIL